jgi:hypothetical protein
MPCRICGYCTVDLRDKIDSCALFPCRKTHFSIYVFVFFPFDLFYSDLLLYEVFSSTFLDTSVFYLNSDSVKNFDL